jgi:SAM-dependent methyltransferase
VTRADHDATRLPRRVDRPTPESLRIVSEVIPTVAPSDGDLADWYSTYAANHAKRWAVELDLLARVDPSASARILDVGSMPPVLLAALRATGRDTAGVDIAPDRFQETLDRLQLRVGRCNVETESLPFPDRSFDIVLFNEVFEHLRINLITTMTEVGRVIAPGGLLFLSTPNARSLRGLHNFVLHGKGGWCGAADIYAQYEKLDRLGHMGHVREYTARDVSVFLGRLGLNVVHTVGRSTYGGRIYRRVDRFLPTLSPVMTLVARKPEAS